MTNRRGAHEGSIRKRPDGRWEARLRLPSGRRRSVYGTTRAEVQQAVGRLAQAVQTGGLVPDNDLRVADFLQEWLVSCRDGLRATTHARYTNIVEVHLVPLLGSVKLTELSPRHVQAAMAEARLYGASAQSIAHHRAVLRAALNQALRWDLVTRNAAALARPPRVPHRQVQPFTIDEARRLLCAVTDTPLEGPVVLGLALGLRQGEILGLRWSEVDFDRCTLRVGVALQRIGGRVALDQPKTDRSRRVLPMPSLVVDALRRRRAVQAEERLQAGAAWAEPIPDLVFTTPLGRPRDGTAVTGQYRKVLAAEGLPPRTFHALRHSAATLALASGLDIKTVSTMLGHSQIALTANTYASVVPFLLQEAADRLNGLLAGRSGSS